MYRAQNLSLAYFFSAALAIFAIVASAVGVFHSDVFRETPITTGNAQGTDLVILVIAVPSVLVSMFLSSSGFLRAQIVWLGAVLYILYNAVFFAYGIHFNALFLIYAGVLGLAFWSLVSLLRGIDKERLRARFSPRTPVRILAAWVVVSNAVFLLLWLKDVVPAILANTAPAGLKGTGLVTNPVQMTDFAFSFSLIALSVVWFWQRRAWGYLLVGGILVYSVIEAISVGTDQVFGHIHDPSQSLGAVPVFAVLAVISLIPAMVFLICLREGRR